jgi:hypothetical protein
MVNLQENAELIQCYLVILRLRKEEADRNHIPTPWEQLSDKEKLLLATYHAHVHQEEDLEEQIQSRNFLREIRAKNLQLRRLRYQAKSQFFRTILRSTEILKLTRSLKIHIPQCLPLRPVLLDKSEPVLPRPLTLITEPKTE